MTFSIRPSLDLSFTQMSNSGFIQSIPVSNSIPGDGFLISYDNTNNIFSFTNPTTDATSLHNRTVSATLPTGNQVLAWNGSDTWEPTTMTSANSLWKSPGTGILQLVTQSDASTGVVFPLGSLDQFGATDIKFLFDSLNGSIRGGQVTGGYWDTGNRGTASVGFGYNSRSQAEYGVVAGGESNHVDTPCIHSCISGGYTNFIGTTMVTDATKAACISGGSYNKIEARANYSIICGGGGDLNTEGSIIQGSSIASFIGGGQQHVLNANTSFIGGGDTNWLNGGDNNVITGGSGNILANSLYGFIGGGASNELQLNNSGCCVVGGVNNIITGGTPILQNSVIGGGAYNTITEGSYGTIPGGSGARIKATHTGCFVWNSDASTLGIPVLAETTALRQCIMRCTNNSGTPNDGSVPATPGFYFLTTNDNTTGAHLSASGSGWQTTSDRNKKENLIEYDSDIALEKVEALPIYKFNMIGSDPAITNIGPMAQDWNELFVSNKDKLSIGSGDLDGVAFAAIKGLLKKVKELEARIDMLEAP
jgi:hypothetical protein